MKNLLLYLSIALVALATSCSKSEEEWVVKGSVGQERLNGWRVFIVPCDPSLPMFTSKAFEDSIGVDSIFVENGQFEFRGKGEFLARITMDKHVRYGTQDLLIVTEPGMTVNVLIDSISHGGGTPQNEALEKWKENLIAFNAYTGPLVQQASRLRHMGDTATAQAISDSLKVLNTRFSNDMLDIANILGHGTAYDLLTKRYQSKDAQ